MKIEELNPTFLKYELIPVGGRVHSANGIDFNVLKTNVEIKEVSMSECNGVRFLCPVCTPKGIQHEITRWSHERGAAFFASPMRYRWKINGTDLRDLCIVPDFENETVIERVEQPCSWNGIVQNGEAH